LLRITSSIMQCFEFGRVLYGEIIQEDTYSSIIYIPSRYKVKLCVGYPRKNPTCLIQTGTSVTCDDVYDPTLYQFIIIHNQFTPSDFYSIYHGLKLYTSFGGTFSIINGSLGITHTHTHSNPLNSIDRPSFLNELDLSFPQQTNY